MHVELIFRGYKSEKESLQYTEKYLTNLLRHTIPDNILANIIGYENVEEEDEFLDFSIDTHIYPDEEERFYLG